MNSQPASPITPSHRPRSLRISSHDVYSDMYSSPYTNGISDSANFSRRSSYTSQNFHQQPSPITPRPGSSRSSRPVSFQHRRKSSSRFSVGSNISLNQEDGGLGNLADELEDALDDEYDEQEVSFLDGLREGNTEPEGQSLQNFYNGTDTHEYHSGNGTLLEDEDMNHSPTTAPYIQSSRTDRRKSRHQRIESDHKRPSYGSIPDQDNEDFPTMSKIINEIESITRTSTNADDTLSEGGGVVVRTTYALRDLGTQTNIETNLSRITAAYTSMAAHRTYKTRDLFSEAHSLLRNNILEVPEEMIDILLSEIELLMSATSIQQQQNPLLSLQILASQTLDLAQTLRSLTDVIQEFRVSFNAASRKLKNTKDMVEDMRIEQELTETSMMLIHAGDWDRRCRERQAAATCREVIMGFGETWGLEVDDRPWTHERAQVTIS